MWGGINKDYSPWVCAAPSAGIPSVSTPLRAYFFARVCDALGTWEQSTLVWEVRLEESISELFPNTSWFTPHCLLVCRQQLCGCWRHSPPGVLHIARPHEAARRQTGPLIRNKHIWHPSELSWDISVETGICCTHETGSWSSKLLTGRSMEGGQTESKAHCQCWCNYRQLQNGETGVLSCNFKEDLRALITKMCWERELPMKWSSTIASVPKSTHYENWTRLLNFFALPSNLKSSSGNKCWIW